MKFKPIKLAPVFIAVGVIFFVCLVRLLQTGASDRFDIFERLERLTYDMRVRAAQRYPQSAATNLGFVFISDDSIAAINNGSLGFHYGLKWPRHIYGRTYRELTAQGAKAVAFDILFHEHRTDQGMVPIAVTNAQDTRFFVSLHPDEPLATVTNGEEVLTYFQSDDYFAWQLKRGGSAILAAERNVFPFDLFVTNAAAVADVTAERDPDGVLRRVKAFQAYHKWWHPVFLDAQAKGYVDLNNVRIEPGKIVFVRPGDTNIEVAIDSKTNFDLTTILGDKLPPGMPRTAPAFTDECVWHMGIALAAQELKLDLAHAEVDLPHGRITLHGAGGVQRIIPVDANGYFYINWELRAADKRLTMEAIENLLEQDQVRNGVREGTVTNRWAGKLAVIGSSATGNELTDRGATPLEKDTLLVSKHWNVANSILTGRFIQRTSLAVDIGLIIAMGILAAILTLRMRVLAASATIALIAIGYVTVSVELYTRQRYWIPLILPVGGAFLVHHFVLVTYRLVFEQADKRRLKSIFSSVVSPKIMNELLTIEKLSLGGARREVTVLFADVRGFTEFTDKNQECAAAYVTEHKLSSDAAETFYDEQARETLATVNLYLGLVADTIIKHDATLDKFIGDCVMAFWGAPTPNPSHARDCVRAAIETQRAIYELNKRRTVENNSIKSENLTRSATDGPPKPLLPILLLGSGINTGMATAGLMGSEAETRNYTVFGREVNLASRLESFSGQGRIIISETTYRHLLRDDPGLAATCVPLPPQKFKGIGSAVKVYEVPWLSPGAALSNLDVNSSVAAEQTSTTPSSQHDKI